jgi:hypothetical protein
MKRFGMNEKPQDYYRVFAPGVPNIRVVSERFTSEADAKRLKREILMAYPAATVRIEKTDEAGRAKSSDSFFAETFCMIHPGTGTDKLRTTVQLRSSGKQ